MEVKSTAHSKYNINYHLVWCPKYRHKVLTDKVEDSDNQLSGLGFSSTKRNYLICKVEGHITRTIKLLF